MASEGSDIHEESDGSLSKQVRLVGSAGGALGTVDTELPAAAALADGAANPTAPAVGSFPHLFNGTTWDRLKSPWQGDDVTASGIASVQLYVYDGSTYDRVRGDSTNGMDVDVTRLPTQGYAAKVSVTRTADTIGYTARDVLGPAAGSTAAITFPNMGAGAGEYMITSTFFERDATALISGETSYTLYLYNVTPPSVLGDNVAFDIPSGDRASYLGKISLGTPVDEGSTLVIEQHGVNKVITLASSSLFGYLVTEGAYTPASAAVHVVGLHAVAL